MSEQYEKKEDMINDILFIISDDNKLKKQSIFAVLDNICWKWTEFPGSASTKYKNCNNWTKSAIEQFNLNKELKKTKYKYRFLKYEHVVPRNWIIKEILKFKNPTFEDIKSFLEKFLIACVVTKEEQDLLDGEKDIYKAQMPLDFYKQGHPDFYNPWLRYKINPTIEVVTKLDDI